MDNVTSQISGSPRVTKEVEREQRLLIYSHDTFGLGHLQRCLKIARALNESISDLSIIVATGSPVVHRFEIPQGLDYIKLPSVRKVGPEEYESRSLRIGYDEIVALRSGILLETVRQLRPDYVLVDHSPVGMKGEMRPALEFVRQEIPSCHTVIGLRDIIDEPSAVIALWSAENIYRDIESLYDSILIYGDSQVFDLTGSCRFTSSMVKRARYTGYISDNSTNVANCSSREANRRPHVVVSVGGGDGATEPVLATYLKMVRLFRDKIDFHSSLITGPFVPEDTYEKYLQDATELGVDLLRFVNGTTEWFANSDLVISTAGYNSVTQILQAADRCILIPRVMHRKEQLLRASVLNELNLVTMFHPDEVTPSDLFLAIRDQLSSESRPLKVAREQKKIDMNGLTGVVAHFAAVRDEANRKRSRNVS
jgi:predicted glycosyltransferase